MLRVKHFRQSTGFCGPASVRMVLNYYGIKASESELAKLSGCIPRKGVGAKGLLKAAKNFGLKGFVKDFADIKDIKKYVVYKKIPVLVNWFSGGDGHYSVLVDIDDKYMYLRDPEFKSTRKMDLKSFKRVWFDFPGNFLRSKDELIIRRLIVLHP